MTALELLRAGLVVSCQPLAEDPGDPMRDSHVQARIAAAVVRAGAAGIRANGPDDVAAIREAVDVPIVGLWKDASGGRTLAEDVVITPTAGHARAVAEAGADIVAVDATARPRPDGRGFADTVAALHEAGALVLADIRTLEEGIAAVEAGADAVASTLSGVGRPGAAGPDVELVRRLAARVPVPVLAEGRYRTAAEVADAFAAGAHAVVVGSAITSPPWITRQLVGPAARSSDLGRRAIAT